MIEVSFGGNSGKTLIVAPNGEKFPTMTTVNNEIVLDDDDDNDNGDDDDEDDDDDNNDDNDDGNNVQGHGLFVNPILVRVHITAFKNDVKLSIIPSSDIRTKCFSFGGETPSPEVSNIFDQVLTYAAHTFKTQVINNAYLTLIPTLTRLTKETIKSMSWISKLEDDTKITTHHVMKKIRGMVAPQYNDGSWHPKLMEFVSEVRQRIGLVGTSYLFDDYLKPSQTSQFERAFLFNRWMLQQLKSLDKRGIKLSPVFSVGRAHVRLDRKTLATIALKAFVGKLIAEYKILKQQLCAKKIINPIKLLPKRPKNPVAKPPATSSVDVLNEWKTADEALKNDYKKQVDIIMSKNDYKEMEARYGRYKDKHTELISSIFKSFRKSRSKNNNWKFDGSIQTDGVAATIQFSKTIQVAKKIQPTDARLKLSSQIHHLTFYECYNCQAVLQYLSDTVSFLYIF